MVAGVAIEAERGTTAEGVTGSPDWSSPVTPSLARPPRGPAIRFFLGAFLSLYGDWLTTVALLVVLFELTNSPAAPAAYMLVRVAPRVMGPWWGGRLADRLSPRVVIVSTSCVQAVVTVSLIGSHRSGLIWALYAAVAVAQFTGALGRPSQGALIPTLVAERDLPRANATYGLFFSTSIFVAPALGALLLSRFGPDPLFAIDAASFVVAAILVATLPRNTSRADRAAADRGREERTPGAMRKALRQPEVRMVAAANFASGLIPTVIQAVLVVAAHERFGGDDAVGFLYSSVGVGGAIGGLVAFRWIPARGWTRFAVFAAVTIEVAATAGFSAAAVAQLALLLLAVSGIAGSSLDTWGATEIQRRAPPGYMGRYNSIIFMSLYSGMLVGALWALGTANLLHWDVALQIACAAMLVLVGLVWVSGRTARSAPAQQKEP